MSTFAIICGFAVMLFLPCFVALRVGRRASTKDLVDAETSAYSDRIIEHAMNAHIEAAIAQSPLKAAPPMLQRRETRTGILDEWSNTADPQMPGRVGRAAQTRVEHVEIEAMKSRALASRAHAEALASVARAAMAKAEAAAADATALENAAAQLILEVRRAA